MTPPDEATPASPDDAIEARRAALAQAPDDWRLALALKQDLRAAGRFPDADPAFRRAARHLPDREWLDHYASLYAFHAGDLAFIEARARALLPSDDPRPHALLGDVARQDRRWPEAAEAFDRAATLAPAQPEYAQKAALARQYARLAAQPWPDHGPETRITIINLDRNPERMADMARHFAAIPHRRQPGVEGARLPSAAVARLTGDAHAPRGTLGCLLGHMAAWEALLAGTEPCAFVVEDDVIPLLPLPPRLGALPLPPGWDVLWVNDRLEPRLAPHLHPAATTAFTAVPLPAAMQAFHPEDNAPGADAYLISRAGAAKLLAWFTADGMAGDVDWRMVAYGMDADAIAALAPHSHAHAVLTGLAPSIPRPDRLAAYVLHPALIRTVGVSSDREDANRLA